MFQSIAFASTHESYIHKTTMPTQIKWLHGIQLRYIT